MTVARITANDEKEGGGDAGFQTGIAVKTKPKTKKPALYKVMLLNDDYTPMEFVVQVLEQFFNKSQEEATRIMLHVHRRGVGLCGVFTFEIAETKVMLVMDYAKRNQYPLQCIMEKE
ncbi:MAG: ATP-dependent Clp protease adapter ClpS [Alphaproteobacteria bacterium]|nr:ATP-dependent Clp protease adapter ClpS [Alphaproteobacteria bacterium]